MITRLKGYTLQAGYVTSHGEVVYFARSPNRIWSYTAPRLADPIAEIPHFYNDCIALVYGVQSRLRTTPLVEE